jgi:hypothetical protein
VGATNKCPSNRQTICAGRNNDVIFRKRQLPGHDTFASKESAIDLPPMEEQAFWQESAELLMEGFSNPSRSACPPPEVLRSIAAQEMKLSEAKPWLAHLGSCGACFRDFRRFQQQTRKKRGRIALISIAALLFLCLASLALVRVLRDSPRQQQASILDLRNYPALRGAEDTGLPAGPPLTVERGKPEVTVYLPRGSAEGVYELQVLNPSDRQVLLKSSGTARIIDHSAMLHCSLGFNSVPAGDYVLAVHRDGMGWSYYPLVVQ